MAIFRIAQEALTNATKHSGSPTIEIVLNRQEDRVHLAVRDHGIGFKSNRASEGALGLRGIRERVRLLGGMVAIDSEPGKGSCVAVDLPALPVGSNVS